MDESERNVAPEPSDLTERTSRFEWFALAAAGAGEALALYYLVDSLSPYPDIRAFLAGAIAFVALFGLVFHFAWTGAHPFRVGAVALVVSLALAGLTYRVFTQLEGSASTSDWVRVMFWVVSLSVFMYVVGPFLQIFQRTGRLTFSYDALFAHSWANFHIGCVGVLFLGAVWVVLGLWAAMFAMIDIGVFRRLFTSGPVASAISGAALAYGVGFALKRTNLILTLRDVTLGVLRLLLIPVTMIALAFAASAPFQGLRLLSATDHASLILLGWAILMIVLLNAVYQDGSEGAPFSKTLNRLVDAAYVVLPLFSLFVIHGLWLRIGQHGLTVFRVYGMVVAFVIAAYCFGYAYAVLRSQSTWLAALQPVNRAIALAVLAIIIALQTPWLDPYRLSAHDQFHRLADGRVPASEFDFGYLKFDLGRPGAESLQRLRGLESHPELDSIRRTLAELDRYDDAFLWRARNRHLDMEVRSTQPLPPGLLEAIRADSFEHPCGNQECFVFPIVVSEGAPASYGLLISDTWHPIPLFTPQPDGTWQRVGQFTARALNDESLRSFIDVGDYEMVPPLVDDLRIGSRRFRFDESISPPSATTAP